MLRKWENFCILSSRFTTKNLANVWVKALDLLLASNCSFLMFKDSSKSLVKPIKQLLGFMYTAYYDFSPPGDIPSSSSTIPQCANSRYHLKNEVLSWQAARDHCVNTLAADLISIETENEFLYIRNEVLTTGRDWWVGLSRLHKFAGMYL